MRNPEIGVEAVQDRESNKEIQEMISIAYAHGLEPKYDESLVESKITPEVAVNL